MIETVCIYACKQILGTNMTLLRPASKRTHSCTVPTFPRAKRERHGPRPNPHILGDQLNVSLVHAASFARVPICRVKTSTELKQTRSEIVCAGDEIVVREGVRRSGMGRSRLSAEYARPEPCRKSCKTLSRPVQACSGSKV